MAKKLLNYGIVAFIIYFVAFRPDAASNLIRGIGALLAKIAAGFGSFFSGLVT